MPQLRKGQLLHYVHGALDPYPGAVDPAIVIRVTGAERSLVALSVLNEHGALFRDAVKVTGGPDSAVRGGAFWPDQGAEADIDWVAAESVEPTEPLPVTLAEAGGELEAGIPVLSEPTEPTDLAEPPLPEAPDEPPPNGAPI